MITIKTIIESLHEEVEWVNWEYTRDRILIGEDSLKIDKVMVCWVATMDIIKEAIRQDCHFIISHENPFYRFSTHIPTLLYQAQEEKKKLLKQHQITIYRCHDLWDLYPEKGVRDRWAKVLQFDFEECHPKDFIRVATNVNLNVKQVAKHIITCITPYQQQGIEVIGDLTKPINRLGIGTGACTDVYEMVAKKVDACLVSDDGITNWDTVQWAMDQQIPILVVNHMTTELAGMEGLVEHLSNLYPSVTFTYMKNTYAVQHIEKNSD